MDEILFGSRLLPRDQVKMRTLGWALTQCDCILIKREIWE